MEIGALELLYEDVPVTVEEGYALLASTQKACEDCDDGFQHPLHRVALTSPVQSFLAYAHVRQRGHIVLRPAALHRPRSAAVEEASPVSLATPALAIAAPPPTARGEDEDERAMYEQLQAHFCVSTAVPCCVSAAVRGPLNSLDVFLLWRRPRVESFRRREPAIPDHILVVVESATARIGLHVLTPSPAFLRSPAHRWHLCSSGRSSDHLRRLLSSAFPSALSEQLSRFFADSTLAGRFSFSTVPLLLVVVQLAHVTLLSIAPTAPISRCME